MVKRTGEVVLGIIGALFYGLMVAFGGFLVWLDSNKALLEEWLLEMAETDPTLNVEDVQGIQDSLVGFGSVAWMILLSAVAAVVLGILAMVLLKGNKNPVAAGIIFLVVAVVVSFTSFGFGIFAGIFYLIAGIMSLVRKPKEVIG
ncbi:DUF4064 domain-containing protein [Aquibacillus koreensis]|uniref:DUF4064 domain-containing protein n=1 Tax=Aquibacillus koreensis TaxID=279446 RepID=A0A9X4AL97_9BACI|nr:DUF4064 domain-containing protein [Aquibacillus koreensis]MCT2536231.1 DUF4064 domain-containing protein [Aquibacillus koreensis]MDC3422215.1 DUF4064 domain-containing protein [Aquibacillus koreensis]